ncbi:hypothetical protein ACWD6I_03620 [Streptomyces sp. NPDC002454]
MADAGKCTVDPLACAGKDVEYPFEKGGQGGAVQEFAEAIGVATSETLKALNGVWLKVDVENPNGPINDVHEATGWLVGYLAVACLLIASAKMALDRRGQPMKQAFLGMWRVLLVGGLAVPVVQALTKASDAYAQDIYEKSDLDDKANEILGVMGLQAPGLVLVFGLLVILSSVVQICLMYLRIGVMIVLVGTLPLAAVSSMTGWGEGWWKKHLGWLAAWLLYKPAAALIIYSATAMTDNPANDGALDTTIAGMGMLILAVFALPALLKLIVPATVALGGVPGAAVAAGTAPTAASGAVSIASGGVGGGAAAGGRAAGPQGSPSTGAGGSGAPDRGPARSGGGTAGSRGSGGSGGSAPAGPRAAGPAPAAPAAVARGGDASRAPDDHGAAKGHHP